MMETDFTKPAYNSYMDITTADELIPEFELIHGAIDWVGLEEPAKEAYLKHATKKASDFNWRGVPVGDIVAPNMFFPMDGLYYATGQEVPNDAVPQTILEYMACSIINTIASSSSGNVKTGELKSKNIGGVALQYTTSADNAKSAPVGDVCSNYIPAEWYKSGTLMGVGKVYKKRSLAK